MLLKKRLHLARVKANAALHVEFVVKSIPISTFDPFCVPSTVGDRTTAVSVAVGVLLTNHYGRWVVELTRLLTVYFMAVPFRRTVHSPISLIIITLRKQAMRPLLSSRTQRRSRTSNPRYSAGPVQVHEVREPDRDQLIPLSTEVRLITYSLFC
jgi:hypothetical protein